MPGELVNNILLADGSNLLQADGSSVILLAQQDPEPPTEGVETTQRLLVNAGTLMCR